MYIYISSQIITPLFVCFLVVKFNQINAFQFCIMRIYHYNAYNFKSSVMFILCNVHFAEFYEVIIKHFICILRKCYYIIL